MNDRKEKITAIIPIVPEYYDLPGERSLDYQAICCFVATGFFLDNETYFVNRRAYRPACIYKFDERNEIHSEEYFQWHYNPRDISFDQTVDEFGHLLEKIVRQGTANKQVILPISGGLDSRSLAAVLSGNRDVKSYSYEFEQGVPENQYGKQIADACLFPFTSITIRKNSLWDKLEDASTTNKCYSEFTHPRQIIAMEQISQLGNVFLLGHWGDVLFDDMGITKKLNDVELAEVVKKKIIKQGGPELAHALWKSWGLPGSFEEYFHEKILTLLGAIGIDEPNAKVRAFKSQHWAPRWTSTNLIFFAKAADVLVPYYHNDMCQFICSIPEEYLAGRKIQIAYLKKNAPELAAIAWQKFTPCNLNNYQEYYSWRRLPNRVFRKIKYTTGITPKIRIKRNWELQFVGDENKARLNHYLSDPDFERLIHPAIVEEFHNLFVNQPVTYSHPVSMLLTLSLFAKQNLH